MMKRYCDRCKKEINYKEKDIILCNECADELLKNLFIYVLDNLDKDNYQ